MNAALFVFFAIVGMTAAVPLGHGISAYSIHTPVSSVSSYSSHIAHPGVIHGAVLHAPAISHVSHLAAPLAINHGVTYGHLGGHGLYGAPLIGGHGLYGAPLIGGHGIWK